MYIAMDEIQIYNVLLNSTDRLNKLTTSSSNAEFYLDWASILPEGKYKVKYSICKTLNRNIPYVFKVKSSTATVPTVVNGLTLINNNNVTMVNDATRGYVFTFNGSNSLKLDVPTPSISTKTFWVLTSTPSADYNNVYSSLTRPIFFARTDYLRTFINFTTPTSTRVLSTVQQTGIWKFYAITTNATETKMYVDGILVATEAVISNNEINPIYFGCYDGNSFFTGLIDDMRMYSSILSPTYIKLMFLENL
jgi:hypothetical protein